MSIDRPGIRHTCLYAVGLAAVLAGGLAVAQVRITEGVFFGCFYGNRGGHCSFDEADGTRHAIGLPSGEESPVIWLIDGVDVGYISRPATARGRGCRQGRPEPGSPTYRVTALSRPGARSVSPHSL